MRCPKCNYEATENSKFCPECGEKIFEPTSKGILEIVEKTPMKTIPLLKNIQKNLYQRQLN